MATGLPQTLTVAEGGTGSKTAAGARTNLSVPNYTSVPASATASGAAGDISWDATYIYVCTATDTWVRATAATW